MFNRMARHLLCRGTLLSATKSTNSAWIQPRFVSFSSATRCCATSSSQVGESHASSAALMVRDIVDAYAAEKGQTFFLPLGNGAAMRQVLFPFERLLSMGIKAEFIADACTQCEEFFKALTTNGTNVLKIIELFVECLSMSYEDAIRFYAKWATGFSDVSADHVQRAMAVFLGRGVLSGPQLGALIQKCPQLLFTEQPQKIDMLWEHISAFFTGAALHTLMLDSPHICLMNSRDIEEKYEYIYFHMGIGPEELTESDCWMGLELEEIMMRHELLLRTGKYTFPDPKKPQLKKENPPVRKIFDVPGTEFATNVACVSHEEWVVFQDLYRHEQSLADKERPYERVKPSMRKRFERRPKTQEKIKGELEH